DQVVVDWREIIDYELELVFKRIDEAVERGVYTAEEGRDEKQAVQAIADGEIAQVERAMKRQAENPVPDWSLPFDPEMYRLKLSMGTTRPAGAPDAPSFPGMIVGTGVLGQRKDMEGEVDRWYRFSPTNPLWATLTTLRIDPDRANVDLEHDAKPRT